MNWKWFVGQIYLNCLNKFIRNIKIRWCLQCISKFYVKSCFYDCVNWSSNTMKIFDLLRRHRTNGSFELSSSVGWDKKKFLHFLFTSRCFQFKIEKYRQTIYRMCSIVYIEQIAYMSFEALMNAWISRAISFTFGSLQMSVRNTKIILKISHSPNSEVTQGAIEVWASLPEEIRRDQSFVPFHQEHERIKGKQLLKKQFKMKIACVHLIGI